MGTTSNNSNSTRNQLGHAVYAVRKDDNKDRAILTPEEINLILVNSDESQSFLHQLRLSGSQLECYCKSPPALMFPRKRGNKIHLVNHYEKGAHADSCHFQSSIKGFREHNAEHSHHAKEQAEAGGNKDFSFNYHKSIPSVKVEAKSKGAATLVSEKTSCHANQLELLFHYLIETTLSNWYYRHKNNSKSPESLLFSLRTAAKDIDFCGSSLYQFIHIGHRGFLMAFGNLYNSIATFGEYQPHSLCFFITDTFEYHKDKLRFENQTYKVKKVIGSSNSVTGPYFICITLLYNSISKKVEPHTAYIAPIVSKQFLAPVLCDLDRIVTLKAIGAIEASDKRFSLKKFCIATNDRKTSLHFLPSFLYQQKNQNKRVIFKEIVVIQDTALFPCATYPATATAWRVNSIRNIKLK